MSIRLLLPTAFLLSAFYSYADRPPKNDKTLHVYISQYENVLGTSMDLKITAYNEAEAVRAEEATKQEITRLSDILSAYDARSEFSQWFKTQAQAVKVSKEFFEVMQLFDEWRLRTGGALDASAEVVTRLWKQAASRQVLPSQKELDAAVAQVKQAHWLLDPKAQTATHLDQAPLMLNSFVKSYIIRHAADKALQQDNVKAVVLNIGGDMVISGSMDERVQISDPKADAENDAPLDQLLVSNRAVATSGNYRRGELINGHWYSHIVDPRTGIPSEGVLSATVVAPCATDAGALATAFNVMTVPESRQLVSTLSGVEWMIITREGEKFTSPGWSKLEIPVKPKEADKNNSPNDFEMIINLEIGAQKVGFAKRPYIAVWVEDTTHFPVRTIGVWHGSDRYIAELKSWYLKYRSTYNNDMNFKSSITSATRSAGKYTLKWDGKDDEGNYVKPGKYIVKIEASREHGTYQLMRQEIICDETPKTINLSGNVEISSASLDYRKKANGN